MHKYIVLKALIVLSSWILGYFGMKHLPLTIVGPINATRPVMVLVGALLVFGERLNFWQWIGVLLAVASFLLLSRSGKKEGIDFKMLTFPDKTLTTLADGLTIGIGLLQHLLIEIVVNLTLRLQFLGL